MKEKKVLAAFVAAFVALTVSSGELMRSSIGFGAVSAANETVGNSGTDNPSTGNPGGNNPSVGESGEDKPEVTTASSEETSQPTESGATSSSADTTKPAESDTTSSFADTTKPAESSTPEETSKPEDTSTPVQTPEATYPPATAPSVIIKTTAKTTAEPEEEEAAPIEVKVKVDDAEAAAKVPSKNKVKNVVAAPSGELKDKDGKAIDMSEVTLGAKEIFNPETVKAAEAAVSKVLKTPVANMNVVDLSMKLGKMDLSKSFDGKITVTIEIPKGQKGKQFKLYRLVEVDGELVAELVEGTLTDDGYEVELDELGMFVLVAEDDAE